MHTLGLISVASAAVRNWASTSLYSVLFSLILIDDVGSKVERGFPHLRQECASNESDDFQFCRKSVKSIVILVPSLSVGASTLYPADLGLVALSNISLSGIHRAAIDSAIISPVVKCSVQFRGKSRTKLNQQAFFYEGHVSVQFMQLSNRYKLDFVDAFSSDYTIWSKIIDQNDCLTYEEDDQDYMAFSRELEYYKTCEPACEQLKSPRAQLTKTRLNVSVIDSDGTIRNIASSHCQDIHLDMPINVSADSRNILDENRSNHTTVAKVEHHQCEGRMVSPARKSRIPASLADKEIRERPSIDDESTDTSTSDSAQLALGSHEQIALQARRKGSFSLRIIFPNSSSSPPELAGPIDVCYSLLSREAGSVCELR